MLWDQSESNAPLEMDEAVFVEEFEEEELEEDYEDEEE